MNGIRGEFGRAHARNWPEDWSQGLGEGGGVVDMIVGKGGGGGEGEA